MVVTRTPTRELLMAAMQQRGILLPAFDGILSSNGTFIPVERLWADMGGAPCQVRCVQGEGAGSQPHGCRLRARGVSRPPILESAWQSVAQHLCLHDGSADHHFHACRSRPTHPWLPWWPAKPRSVQ
jgi:hypothetical protein